MNFPELGLSKPLNMKFVINFESKFLEESGRETCLIAPFEQTAFKLSRGGGGRFVKYLVLKYIQICKYNSERIARTAPSLELLDPTLGLKV